MEASTATELELRHNVREGLDHDEKLTGAMRLLRALAQLKPGLSQNGIRAAAALAVELDRPIKDRAENDKYDERA